MSAPPTDVVERLEHLADAAPAGSLDPNAMWARGRRRQRLRWVAVTACAAVVAGLGAAVAAPLVRWADPQVATVPEQAGIVLPDVIRSPGRWEPAFDRAPGPLSTVGVAMRAGLFGSGRTLWGISGATGESRFLDLPAKSAATGAQPGVAALSPDGTKLAYWTAAPESWENRFMGVAEVAAGLVVLDLTTGEHVTWTADATYGMGMGGLAWAGEELWIGGGAFASGGQGRYVRTTWTWGDEPEPAPATRQRWLDNLSAAVPAGDGFLVPGRRTATRGVHVVDGDGASSRVRLVLELALMSPAASPDGRRIAGIAPIGPNSYDGAPHDILVGEVVDGRAVMQDLEFAQAHAVLGWGSDTELVVASPGLVGTSGPIQVSRVDVEERSMTSLLEISGGRPVTYAAQAWAGEVVSAPPAPFAPDQRLLGGGGALVLLLVSSVWLIIRGRRGHP